MPVVDDMPGVLPYGVRAVSTRMRGSAQQTPVAQLLHDLPTCK